jgi:sterol 3beta-glucosyltransferase
MAEALNVPLVLSYLCPMYPSGDFANPFVTTSSLPLRLLNRLTHGLFGRLWWRGQKAMINDLRRQVGLPPTDRSTYRRILDRRSLFLHAFSEHLQPRPADWGSSHVVTGFWRLPDAFRARLGEDAAPPDLAAWLDAGPAPIFIGFGSMPVEDPETMLATTVALARQLQTRIVIGAGWSRLAAGDLPDDVFLVGSVNHEWLFPLCRAVVHHGGAGTTAASLRAGRPTLICSVFADQPYWGRRITELGVGAHIPFRNLSPVTLERALRALLQPGVAERAEALGERLRAENGVGRAVLAIKQHLTAPG